MSISKVKSVTGNGSFENDYGALQENGKKLLFSFEYEMEDGTIIKANHKTDTSPFPVGSEVEYEVKKTHPDHGKSGSVKKPDTGNYQNNATKPNGVDVQLMIVRQSSLNRAVDILINNCDKVSVGDVEILAERLTSWVMQETKPEAVVEAVQNGSIGEDTTDDLPF